MEHIGEDDGKIFSRLAAGSACRGTSCRLLGFSPLGFVIAIVQEQRPWVVRSTSGRRPGICRYRWNLFPMHRLVTLDHHGAEIFNKWGISRSSAGVGSTPIKY
jgi:hypothetical protein